MSILGGNPYEHQKEAWKQAAADKKRQKENAERLEKILGGAYRRAQQQARQQPLGDISGAYQDYLHHLYQQQFAQQQAYQNPFAGRFGQNIPGVFSGALSPAKCWGVLGIEPGSSKDEIKKAYRRLAIKHHPDKGGDPKEFQRVQEAYDEAITL